MADKIYLPYAVANHLKSLAFETIWNEPQSRSRVNFALPSFSSDSLTSAIDLGFTRIMLPIAGLPFRIFSVDRTLYQGWATPVARQWRTTSQIGAATGASVLTYDYSGRIINPNKVWVLYCDYNETIYIAIPKFILAGALAHYTDQVYQTLFRDTTPQTMQSFKDFTITDVVSDPIAIQQFLGMVPSGDQNKVIFVQNGKIILSENIASVKYALDDQILILYDPDITSVVDISIDDEKTGYQSTLYNGYRELLHTPKANNPDNLLLRSQDVSLVIYDPQTGNARYLHRVANNFMMNVTHNDFSLDRGILNAFRDSLQASSVAVRIFYRLPTELRYLTHDINCIETLYQHDDATIVDVLLGIKDLGVPEWKAANLENSSYIGMMGSIDNSFQWDLSGSITTSGTLPADATSNGGVLMSYNQTLPKGLTSNGGVLISDGKVYFPKTLSNGGVLMASTASQVVANIYASMVASAGQDMVTDYTAALGYYRVAEMLTQMKASYTYTQADMLVEKPPYLQGSDVDATVFSNGSKVQDYFVSITQQNNAILIGFLPGANVPNGARIDVHMNEKHLRTPVLFVPSEDSPTLFVDHREISLYKAVPTSIQGVCGNYTTAYAVVPEGPTTYATALTVGGWQLTFDPSQYGKTFYLSYGVGRDCLHYAIDDMVAKGKPILFPLQYTLTDGSVVPLLTLNRTSVYLNGNRLIPNIDYTCIPLYTDTNELVETAVVVSNITYLKSSGNIVEVVVDDFTTLFYDVGYNRSSVCQRDKAPWVWLDSCSNVFTRGMLIPDVADKQAYLLAQTSLQDGSPYYSEVLLDRTVASYMRDVSPNADYDIRTRADNTVTVTLPPIVDPIVISQAYVLYSPYLTQIISDMVSKKITVVWDESDQFFLNQFTAYDLLKARDPVIGLANPDINRNLVDISVSYTNPQVTDLMMIKCIDRLTQLVFNNKTPTLGATLV